MKCTVLCCSSILKLFFMSTQLLCSSTDVMLFSQISSFVSLTWRQLPAVRSWYEAGLQRPPRPSSPLTEASSQKRGQRVLLNPIGQS